MIFIHFPKSIDFFKAEKIKVDDFQLFPQKPSTFSKQANPKVDDFQLFPQKPSTFSKLAKRKVDDFREKIKTYFGDDFTNIIFDIIF